jgi:deoxyribonuclease-1
MFRNRWSQCSGIGGNFAPEYAIREVYRGHQTTFYCGSQYTQGKVVIHTNGYVPKKNSKRAHRLEWEHVVPAHAFGQSFKEWREGHPDCIDSKGKAFKGRNCARKVVIKFRYMESDMYNLVPAIGEINGLRSNYSFAIIPGENRDFGTCDMEIQGRKVEPPPAVRGNIARIYWYMDSAYPGHGVISRKNRKLYKAWDEEDPVDDWECKRAKRIKGIQGNENPFVKKACIENGMW